VTGNPYSFSRVFGDFTNFDTIGPYDDEAPSATLLSDGNLNSDDAPMPALPITVSIEPNAAVAGNEPEQETATVPTDPSDLGGVGGLYGVEKWLVYSHDFDTADVTPHGHPTTHPAGNGAPIALTNGLDGGTAGQGNLYNPFYQAYIPSTDRPISQASGVDGVYDNGSAGSSGADFPGFSNGDTDPYTFWKALDNTTTDAVQATDCLRRDEVNGTDPLDGPTVYQEPYYPTNVTVYTDERGEAYVDYNPGNGFYLNNLGISLDRNSACDLQSLLGDEIGSSTIYAQTEYPYQSVPYTAPPASNTLTKVVDSEWSKTLTAYPKEDIGGTLASIFVAQATDINGQPFENELVCFDAQPVTGLIVYNGTFPGVNGQTVDTIGADAAPEPSTATGFTCAYTNDDGQAAVEIPGSVGGIDVTAWFVDEHIFRDVTTTLGDPTPVTSGTPPTVIPSDPVVLHSGSAGTSGGSSSSSSSSTGASSSPAATVAPTTPLSVGSGNSCKLNSVHLYAKKGYVQLKVSCTQSKTDSIVLRTYKANGKIMHSYRKTIAAGKTVRIRLSTRKVAHVSVSV
jgi:hypothetical protein